MDSPVTISAATTIEVSQVALAMMEGASEAAWPQEACGILLGKRNRLEQVVRAANVHTTPETRFEIDPQALIDAHRQARSGGPEVLGYFHSHPSGDAVPSVIDATMAAGDGMVWAILGDGEVRFWRDHPNGFRELSYRLVAA